MLDPVPWLIGGGAEHSPEVARLFTYAATSGAEGVVNVNDLKVSPLTVPGGAVRVAVGAALIRNRATNAVRQTYVGRGVTATDVEVAATGSSGGRSDLVVMQVEDPFMAGEPWQTPADPKVGPYLFLRVISNVPSTTTRLQDIAAYAGRSAVTLARIDIPANTGTITAGMITDLRKVANPRSDRFIVNAPMPGGVDLTSSSFIDWPNDGVVVQVPDWATTATIRADIQVGMYGPNAEGVLRLAAGATVVHDQGWNIDTEAGGAQRITMQIGGTVPLVDSPGGPLRLKLRGRRTSGTGRLSSRPDSTFMFDVEFRQQAI